MKYTIEQIKEYFKNGDISETQRDDLLYQLEEGDLK